jgi:site-specific DNA-cytosine methylase
MKVLSLFDGISGGQVALERAGISCDYYASEIDKYAIKITQANYPQTVQLGDVKTISEIKDVDLLIGGFPCQSFSVAGKQLNFDDPRGQLFFELLRLKKTLVPKYFLFENVVMNKSHESVISGELGVDAIKINSSLVSAQNRNRLYWTNIPFDSPEDRGIEFRDILETVDKKYYVSERQLSRIDLGNLTRAGGVCFQAPGKEMKKCPCLMARHYKGISGKQHYPAVLESDGLRKLSPEECEKLQTFPLGYTKTVSDTQRYKALGNSFTVDIITQILKGIK